MPSSECRNRSAATHATPSVVMMATSTRSIAAHAAPRIKYLMPLLRTGAGGGTAGGAGAIAGSGSVGGSGSTTGGITRAVSMGCVCSDRRDRHRGRRDVIAHGEWRLAIEEQLKVGLDRCGCRVSMLDLIGQHLADDRRQRRGARGGQRRPRRVAADRSFELARISFEAGVGPMAGQHLVEDHAERPEVDVLVDVTVLETLGRRVG